MTVRGWTAGSRPVSFRAPLVSPQIGVISDPAYVVGTARIGNRRSRTTALPRPVAEPPPMVTIEIGAGLRGQAASGVRVGDRDVGSDIADDTDDAVTDPLGQPVGPGVAGAVGDEQHTRRTETVEFLRHLVEGAVAEHHPAGQRVVRERPHRGQDLG